MTVSTRRELLIGAGALAMGSLHAARSAAPPELHFIATGIRGPEGPSVLPDRSVSCVEFKPGNLLRVHTDGTKEILATPGSGIVGTVMGRDGALYAAKLNTAAFMRRIAGPAREGAGPALAASPSALLRVNLETKASSVIYSQWNGVELPGPNDLVFDEWGDLWISDATAGAVFNARTDGTHIDRLINEVPGVNGITLAPDKRTLYIYSAGKLLSYAISGRGKLRGRDGKAVPVASADWPAAAGMPDGFKTERSGNLLVACGENGLVRLSPRGQMLSQTRWPNQRIINLAFSPYEKRVLYLAANEGRGMVGGLARITWDEEGLA